MTQTNYIDLSNKWIQEVGIINEEEQKNSNDVIHSISEVRLKDFQYKATTKILVTKSFLHKIQKVDNSIYDYCNQHSESFFHLFARCQLLNSSATH